MLRREDSQSSGETAVSEGMEISPYMGKGGMEVGRMCCRVGSSKQNSREIMRDRQRKTVKTEV